MLCKKYLDLTKNELPVQRTKQIVLKSVTTVKKKRGIVGSTLGRAFGSMSVSGRSEDLEKEIAEKKGEKVTDWAHNDIDSDVQPSDFNLIKVIGRGSFGKVMLVTLKGPRTRCTR